MPRIVADRFLGAGSDWIDLATSESVKLRLIPAGPSRSQMEWSARCEALANLRHPLINPLLDFGVADREHVFEAYAARGPVLASGASGEKLLTHAVRFLAAYGLDLPPPIAELLLRPIAPGMLRAMRPLGVFLQRRVVFDAILDALDTSSPGGLCGISVHGSHGSGLRTLRLATARAARLQGYVPLGSRAVQRFPWLVDRVLERHVCVIEAEPGNGSPSSASLTAFISRLAAASARRHLIVSFARPGSHAARSVVHVDFMGVTAMAGMVFLDPETGPSAGEVFAAARVAEGRPGVCLARLGAHDYVLGRSRAMVVHETPQPYESEGPARSSASSPAVGAVKGRGAVLRAVGRAERLARGGRHAAAERLLSRAARVLSGRGDSDLGARACLAHGWLARDRARGQSAIAYFERARDAAASPSLTLLACIGMGAALVDDGRLIDADAVLRTALLAAEGVGDVNASGAAAVGLARCCLWRGQPHDALAVLCSVPDGASSLVRARALALEARAHTADGRIPSAIRCARAAVETGASTGDLRVIASAFRALGAAAASAGDAESAAKHFAEAIRAARTAHLPLTVFRLRLHACDAGIRPPKPREVERIVARAHEWPRLLRFYARAVHARLSGADLDAATRSFVASSGAAALERPVGTVPPNPVADLEAFLDLAHAAPDERTALEHIAVELLTRIRAATVLIVSGMPDRRVLALAGRAWQGDPHIAWRALGGGLSVPVERGFEPAQAAEPVRYGGEIVAAVAARWIAGSLLDRPRVTALLRVGALAMAASVRSVLDRTIPPPPSGAWHDLLGDSAPAQSLREAVARAARAPFPVLVQGESGSGKELVARAIHRLGARRDRRFCALNCAALSDELVEAELFGHARGAFTGAIGERPGLFEEADGGTLFLDEIGELSARAQAKLLRVLQDGEVRRVGENVSRRVDVRIIAATNRRLDDEAAAGRFRADLRFRLDVVRIEVPPLRERVADVPMLASRFWTDAAARVGSRATLAPDAVAALARYDWPGNVRELQNVIAWMAVHSPRRGRIGPSALPQHVAQGGVTPAGSLEAAKEEFERRFIKAALASAGGQRARAAQAIGVTRQGLAKMIRRLKIE